MPVFRPSLAFVILGTLLAGCQPGAPRDSRLQAPQELADAAKAAGLRRIFTNPRARALLTPDRSPAFVAASAEDVAALQNPAQWRRLDRARHFDSVLLAGPAGEFLPLLAHLATSPDFRLVRLDHWGALFVHGSPAPYIAPPPGSVGRDLSRAADRATCLAQTALMLQAIGQLPSARTYATASIESAPKEPIVHVAAAALALARKDYALASESVRRALDLAPNDPGALEMAARISAATGATEQAWNFASRLKSLAAPDDMNVLFLHARIASAAHAYGAEQDSLERLVAAAEKLGLPTTDYRVYLGQCYARQGLPRPALDQLERAARDPDLTDKQRTDLATAIATVRQRAGELSQ